MTWKIKSPSEWKTTREKMQEDMSKEVIFRMQMELKNMKSYYASVGDSFAYDNDGLIFSTDWAAAILNQGRDAGSYAPREKILDWVKKYKNPGGSPRQQYMDMIRINQKLYDEGITPNWYVDNVLFEMEEEHE